MEERLIFAGFGGQGVMLMGKLLAYGGMIDGKNVSWLPSYGPEMRGGTANCHVIISDDPIGSPIVTDATIVVAMNKPSLERFEKDLVSNGRLFINSSLIDIDPKRNDIKAFAIDTIEAANKLGNSKVANMVMFGAINKICNLIKENTVDLALQEVLGKEKENLIEINKIAIEKGREMF